MTSKIRIKNKIDICPTCNKEFEHFKWDKQVHCSKECFYESIREKRPKHNCTTCEEEIKVTKYRHTRNEEYYCNKECYNNRRKTDLKRLKRGTKFYDDLLKNSSCECGVSEKYLLQIHHKDGNNDNNNSDNLEIMCANCHIRRHLRRNKKGELVYHTKSLSKLELV